MTQIDASLAHCREDPPWSWCGDRRAADFGSVFAWRAARGAVMFTFDRRGRHHALTLFAAAPFGREVAILGRRFDVVWASAAEDAR